MEFMRALPALLLCDSVIAGSLDNKCTFLRLVTHLHYSVFSVFYVDSLELLE